MKLISSLLFSILFLQIGYTQNYPLADSLFVKYEAFKEQSIKDRRFTQSDIDTLITSLSEHDIFKVKELGTSVEGRPIYLVSLGDGDKDVLLWSQMHGDESTATMALFDLFNFFKDDKDFTEFKKSLLQDISLHFIPMLNPDGAENFRRRNALGIDINRDALRLTSPESQILKSVRDSLQPEFGFNLHDQSVYYTSGDTSNAATISFLAPAYDYEQSENEVRTRAMKLIAYLNPMLQQFIPGGVAKYSDAHEPRAFGDMIQKWGTSTVLIESGGYPDDPEKQFIRKLNFITLLTSFDAISEEKYGENTTEEYFDIPMNRYALTDLLIKEATMVRDSIEYLIDLSIRHYERTSSDSITYYRSSISDIGDLSTIYGYNELDVDSMYIYPGKMYPDTLQNLQELADLSVDSLLNQGYTEIFVREAPDSSFVEGIPLNIVSRKNHYNRIGLGEVPNFIIKNEDSVQYVVVNGFVYDVKKGNTKAIRNSLVVD